ncbi:hypothetical protein FSS13T_13740 [Flavobacterium saliperosum S13]|uniref:YhhN-like protein n=2 Tax=Flavobacterium saliperosum TaxID=329186 RepID=A0A1G4VE44_9FLAO|nr:lysoplasmalogenase family protein [Flavobacterium saliperosum]ESU25907.1 hypothetical protein FSS13T_13740 [Flavobacterium saliperosum S13]SCX05374.1 YhhN-like protein [Flavobacterium saliperosum]
MKSEFRKNITTLSGIAYIMLSLFVIFGEYEKDIRLISLTKPFLIPALVVLYLTLTKKINWMYVLALVFVWVANILFITQTQEFIFRGAASYLVFWIFITFLVLVNTPFPNRFSFLIAIVPFSFVYCCVFQLVYENIEQGVYLFFLNGTLMIFLGGYSLANYFIDSNKPNTYLLISVLMFTFIQFLVSIDLYYVSMKLFRPMAMLLFVTAQFFLLKTFLSFDKMNFDRNKIQN